MVQLGAEKVKKAKVHTLKSEFESLTMKDTEQLDDFYMRLNGLVTNIRALGEKVEEAYVVKKILRAVPIKFLQIVSAIEKFGNLEQMSIEEIVRSLKAHEERLCGKTESSEHQLRLTEEEWVKRENKDGQLLLTRDEWLKRANKDSSRGRDEARGRDFSRGGRDRAKIYCFNCLAYGYYTVECRKSRRQKERIHEANLAQVNDDEPTLLLAKCQTFKEEMILLNEGVSPRLVRAGHEEQRDTSVWYLDNGASNHMTGHRSKFHIFRQMSEG
ncbi:uncharacterized protein LOC141666204 [Apium graveolens]|uniref:uncharacterized protein LOC141666204 n=1 Tax=Apium graveolens TaxID=4045 RepID=UPI003D7A84B1